MQLDITRMQPTEIPFSFSLDAQTDSRSGCIGHLCGSFGGEQEVLMEWFDHQTQFKTHDFGVELNKVVQALRSKGGCGLLADRDRMAEFCARHPETALKSNYEQEYGFKLKTVSRTYLLRCDPHEGKINFYLYAYETPLLEHCIGRYNRPNSMPDRHHPRGEAR